MKEKTNSVTLQSLGGDAQNLIDEVISQFNEWLVGKCPAKMLLNFTTSKLYPLRMKEVAIFSTDHPIFDEGNDIGYSHNYDDSLNDRERVEILNRTELSPSPHPKKEINEFICEPPPQESLLELLIRLLTGRKRSVLDEIRDNTYKFTFVRHSARPYGMISSPKL